MKRLAMMFGCLMMLATPAMAISEFGKQWKNEYLGDGVDDEFKSAGRKAGCYVCHVKGEDKKKVRNEYGKALGEFLDAKDFPKDYLKDNPEEAKAKILEGFKKVGEKKSSDGKTFAEKIKANELPATDAGL
ncbi:hypothetical protein K227x_11000 [Rubripirellula lacrimiformis]|uniref:Cytochrome c domain-containing protein n=1 Tax=Rubripirellula lacrimiformis TaxID=1930273 RepID=A0A517N6G8_9BACT|nr:hypothetical protein [Rubripirellula lacrimiformis]QDT02722.1 hypothetical protein K227x_11000 [Rubripirellula lacrimiformis]